MNLRSLSTVLWERRWYVLGVLVVALLCSPILARFIKPTYVATANIAYVGNELNGVLPSVNLPDLVLSSAVMERVKVLMHYDDSFPIDNIRLATDAKIAPHSSVIPITTRSKDPTTALQLANAVADAAVYEYHELAGRQYTKIIDQLQSQLAAQQSNIRNLDFKLQGAVQRDSFVGSNNALETISTRLDELQSQRAVANASYVADQAAASAGATRGSKTDGLGSVIREQALASDPVYQALRAAQAKDVADYQTTQAGYTDAYPGLAGLQTKVKIESNAVTRFADKSVAEHPGASSTYAQLVLNRQTALAQVAGDRARVSAIDGEISSTEARLRDLPKYGVAANQLRLQRDGAAAAYNQLQLRLQTTLADQTQAESLGSLIVLDHPTGASAKIPRGTLVILIAALVLGLAVGAAYAAEALDPRIRTSADVEALYGSPHIGTA